MRDGNELRMMSRSISSEHSALLPVTMDPFSSSDTTPTVDPSPPVSLASSVAGGEAVAPPLHWPLDSTTNHIRTGNQYVLSSLMYMNKNKYNGLKLASFLHCCNSCMSHNANRYIEDWLKVQSKMDDIEMTIAMLAL